MKNLIISFVLFFLAVEINAQCVCQLYFVESSDCCYLMYYSLDDDGSSVPCFAMGYDQVTIHTNWIPAQGSEVVSVTSGNPDFTVSVNAANNIVTAISSGPLFNPSAPGVLVLIGTICLANGPQAPLDAYFQVSFSNSSIPAATPCDYNFTENLACAIPGEWTTICGDDSTYSKVVNRVHAFNDGVYVTGVKEYFDGLLHATFSKYDMNDGTLIWQKEMGDPTYFTDFAYIPEEDAFICVGRTDPFQTPTAFINNRSVLVKFDDQGNMLASKFYDQVGREGFSHILRHSNPPNPNFPYYVLGTRNPDPGPSYPPPPSHWDVPVVFNIDADLNVNWVRRYDNPFLNTEYEATRGFFEKGNELVFTGNDIPDNDGVLIPVNANNGIPGLVREFTSGDFDLYEGLGLPNGRSVVAGTDFGANEAVVFVMDNSGVPLYGLRYPAIKEFREIGMDANGRIYTVGPLKNGTDFYVINRIINTGSALQHDISAYLDNGGAMVPMGHFDVTPDLDAIFYTDGRKGSPGTSFGVFGVLVTSLDLNLSNNTCLVPSPQSPVSFTPQSFPLEINAPVLPEPSFVSAMGVFDLPYVCDAICGTCNITALFSFSVNCFTVNFTDLSSGTAPLTYAWDFDCDGSIDATTQNPVWTLPDILPHQVCLTVSDAAGCTETYTATVQAQDQAPPTVSCSDLTLSTDPGECFATLGGPYLTYSDNCFPNPDLTVVCVVNGLPIPATLPKGDHHIFCTVTDPFGNVGDCDFTIRVEDNEPPVVTCPENITVNVPVCVGQFTTFLEEPTFTDNCPMGSASCDMSGEVTFFCGPPTTITCTATDMAGNTDVCTYTVTVNCLCADPAGFVIECTSDPDVFTFSISLNNLSGSANPAANCTLTAIAFNSNVVIQTQSASWIGNTGTVTGTFAVTGPPVPTSVTFALTLACDCMANACSVNQTAPLPCCEFISLEDEQVCSGAVVDIPLIGCGALNYITQVNWYVAPAPCPPADWGDPFKIVTDPLAFCDDLELYTQYFSGDICVYAEVFQNNNAGPCTVITSNAVTIHICDPVECSISGAQDYCYTGSSIVPGLLTVNLVPALPECNYTVQWHNAAGPIPGATALTYQPPALAFLGAPDDCYYDHVFFVEIADNCGLRQCAATIRLYNDNAPAGTLVMDPVEPMPFCPGEDATLRYTPECAGEPPMWEWWESADGLNYNFLPDAGTMNPLYNTNKLYADTWYRVKKYVGGGCPVDVVDFMIDVKAPLAISPLTASYSPPCAPTSVVLDIGFVPCSTGGGCNCNYTVDWYKDGILLHSGVYTSSPTTPPYTHSGLPEDLPGNYYAIVSDNCCPGQVKKSNVVEVEKPWDVLVLGPCSRCGPELVDLEGVFLNALPSICTYQWTASNGGHIVGGTTGTVVTVDKGGTYTFQATCDGCTKQASFDLLHCPTVATKEVWLPGFDWSLSPNPTDGNLEVRVIPGDLNGPFEIALADALGKEVLPRTSISDQPLVLELKGLPPGIYFVTLYHPFGVVANAKVVRQ